MRFSSSDYDVVPFIWYSCVGASVVRIRSYVVISVVRISLSCVVTCVVRIGRSCVGTSVVRISRSCVVTSVNCSCVLVLKLVS